MKNVGGPQGRKTEALWVSRPLALERLSLNLHIRPWGLPITSVLSGQDCTGLVKLKEWITMWGTGERSHWNPHHHNKGQFLL